MPKIGQYYAELGVQGLAGVQAAFGSVRRGLQSLASAATAPIRGLSNVLAGLASPAGLAGAALGAAGVAGVGGIMSLAAQTESLATQFEVLLGSADAAKQMMAEINKFAAATPFEQMELGEVAKQLLAYGTAAQDILPTMRRLGDIAALSGARLADLAAIYGKVQAQGRLTAETLESWQARGIPITRELAAVLGVAETQVRELVSEGRVGFSHVQAAIARLTDAGGQFAGGMERLSKTTGGLWSTVTGNLKTALAELGTAFIETFNVKGLLAGLGDWLGGLGEKIRSAGEWVRGFLDQWKETVTQVYETFAAACRMIWEVVSTVFSWIGNLLQQIFSTLLGGLLWQSTEEFKTTMTNWLASVQFFFENWRLYLAIAWERFKLWCENLWPQIKAFFQNAWILLTWFLENWRDVLTDIWNLAKTTFSNLITNLKNLWNAFWTWVKGGRWEFDWTPLTQGFQSAIKKMPEFVEADIKKTTPALERLEAELAKRREEFYARKQKKAAAAAESEIKAATAPAAAPTAATTAAAPAAAAAQAAKQAGTEARIRFVALEALANQMQEEAARRQEEKIVDATQKTAEATDKLSQAVDGNTVRVQVVGGRLQAAYG